MRFRTMADVRKANKASGQYWFSPDTMRFFNSVVETGLYGGRFFVTSERRELSMPKLYTVREALPDGDIRTIGGFQGFNTLENAIAAAVTLGRSLR